MSKCVKCGNEILTGDIHWEMGLCNNCYNELYKDHKTHISLDKMWLKLAQDFRDENEKLQDKVANLESKLAESEKKNFELVAKINLKEHKPAFCTLAGRDCEALGQIAELQKQLAEKDKAIENWQTMYESVVQTCHNDKEEIERLNKKLAEKEKEIERLNLEFETQEDWQEKWQKLYDETCNLNQDKISFAVEQLEQLKKLCQENFNWWENSEWEGDMYDKSDVSNAYFDIEANVDNQIEELKKEMK